MFRQIFPLAHWLDVELAIDQLYVTDIYPQACMFRGRGFCCPASPP